MEYSKLYKLTEEASKKLYEPIRTIESVNEWKTQMINLIDEISQLKLSISTNTSQITESTSLDPTDWLTTRHIAHQLLDTSIESIQNIRNRPVWQPIPDEIRTSIQHEPVPKDGQTLVNVSHDVLKYVFPYTRGNTHPRFWGWVMGEGTIGGILADMMMSTININAGGCTHSGVLVERTVIQWMRQIFGFPQCDNGGLIVSATSAATILCMASARRQYLTNVRQDGMINAPRLIIYASKEVHVCVSKALELLGFGSNSLHLISVDEHFCINIDELRETIENDKKTGCVPFCIVGCAGTVNTGAFDSLEELAAIARKENLWFHVDGAFGALVILDPERRHLVQGIEQADSLAFDYHKWLHCSYDAGCALVRNGNHLLSTFSVQQSYLATKDRGCAGDKPWFSNLGSELSRQFRALKIWFTLKEHGIKRLGEKIRDNCEQAQYLASLLEKYEDFIHVIRPVTLNIVNFRLKPKELDKSNDKTIDDFNDEVLADIQISGIALASTTRFHNRLYIRVCIVSHRCTLEDFDIFVDSLLKFYRIRVESLKNSIDMNH